MTTTRIPPVETKTATPFWVRYLALIALVALAFLASATLPGAGLVLGAGFAFVGNRIRQSSDPRTEILGDYTIVAGVILAAIGMGVVLGLGAT